MKYYRLAKGKEVKYVALPSEFWLPVAEYVCFNPDYDGSCDTDENLFDMVSDYGSGPDWDFCELPETKYDTCVELSQEEYHKLTGGIEKADYYHRNDEPYYEGELPEDWEDKAQQILLPDSYWCDQFGYEGDWCKVVNNQIDSENMFYTMLELMQGVDPELQVEAYDRWIYGNALAKASA